MPEPRPEERRPPQTTRSNYNRGTKRLLQILISESAHLIWVLRCERTIQERTHTGPEIQALWLQAINFRLSDPRNPSQMAQRD
jgi:hypothetical protein